MYYSIVKNAPYYSSLMSLKIIGLYPTSSSSKSIRNSMIASIFNILFAITLCNVGAILHLVVSLKGSKGAEVSEDMAIAIGGIGFLMCELMFKTKWSRWAKFWSAITDFSTFGKPDGFDKIKDRCNIISFIFTVYIYIGMTGYAGITVMEMQCDKQDMNNKICGTLTQIWLPIHNTVSPLIIKVVFVLQLYVCIWVCLGAGNLIIVVHESTEFLVCHIKSLKINIRQIFDYEDEESRKRKLSFCVRYHNFIIELADQLNVLTKKNLGHISLIAAVVIGMIGNQIVNKYKPLGAAIYLFGYIMSIFILSHAGQRVSNESLSLADAVFDSEWNKGSREMIKDLAFMMAKCQEPLIISSLPLGSFNYALFLTILKASYSYLTLLQQMTASENK